VPADPANIVRAVRRARTPSVSSSAVLADFPSARDALDNPDPGYFESATDALSALAAKAALIGVSPPLRRFTVEIGDQVDIDPVAGLPTIQLKAPELGIDRAALLCRYELDLENETTTMEVLG
jgi:hypothetical protein